MTKHITVKAWRLWFWPAIAVFLVLEVMAITNGITGDTLSEYVWSMAWGKRAVVIAFLSWLIVHFATKGKV